MDHKVIKCARNQDPLNCTFGVTSRTLPKVTLKAHLSALIFY